MSVRHFATAAALIRPHVPMIKFRAGANPGAAAGAVQAASTQPSPAPAGSMDWWERPAQFGRPTLDEDECDAINSGGRDKPWQ